MQLAMSPFGGGWGEEFQTFYSWQLASARRRRGALSLSLMIKKQTIKAAPVSLKTKGQNLK